LGAGNVAEQVIECLRNRGIGSLRVVNRSFDRAAELAKKVGGEAVAWESLESVLGLPDILVTSVSSASPVLSRELLERAIAARSGRPVFVVDLAVPRNVAPEAAGLYNLYLYNIDDLGEIVEQNKKARKPKFLAPRPLFPSTSQNSKPGAPRSKQAPLLTIFAANFISSGELLIREKLAEMEDVSPDERARIAHITEELIERVLEQPSQKVRHGRGMRGRLAGLEALRHLFGLDEDKE